MTEDKPLILNGKALAIEITQNLKAKVDQWNQKPKFTIIQIGDLFASNKYIKSKMLKAKEIGIEANLAKFDENIDESTLISQIKKLSQKTDALIVQLPLPKTLNVQKVLDAVPFDKDVDGLSTKNSELFYNNSEAITPATPKGILMLLQKYNIELKGKKTYVIGESNLVGKPTKELLKRAGGITKSFNIDTGIKGSEEADVLVVAAGFSKLVKAKNVKHGAIIIDVGINSLGNNEISGDVDFENVSHKVQAISPVPGGVGPMTIIALMSNIIEIFEKKK